MKYTIGQGTTPYLQMAVYGYDLSECPAVYMTLEQGKVELTLQGDRVSVEQDGTDSVITAHLTQKETVALDADQPATFQARWRDTDGEAYSTEVFTIYVYEALYKGVI